MTIFVFFIHAFFSLMLFGCSEQQSSSSSKNTTTTPATKIEKIDLSAQTKKDAESGKAEAQYSLGVFHQNGNNTFDIPKDEVKAVQWFQKAAAQGHDRAQYMLGSMYSNGEGVPKDNAKAIEFYEKAAEQGFSQAQSQLGFMYTFGNGVKKDVIKGLSWYQKAAALGNPYAQVILGDFYVYGSFKELPKNIPKGIDLYQKSASQGNADAQYRLGNIFILGDGLPKDVAKGIELYKEAAAQGHADAQFWLGSTFSRGKDVPKDAVNAVEWYQKAAAQGHAKAQMWLSFHYQLGDGIPKNEIYSYAWINLAAAQGLADAVKSRNLLEKMLTPSQLAESQRLATNWKLGDKFDNLSAAPSASISLDDSLTKHGTGTAFIINKDGFALTNHHVVNGCKEIRRSDVDGVIRLITTDSINDLALLKLVNSSANFAFFNPEPTKLRQGEDVVVFGYPLNSVLSSGGNFTPGTLSALSGLGNNTNQIQITAPIQPGSSGSPVMDKHGTVVGVVSMKLDDKKMVRATGQIGQNVNFAINGQTTKSFLDANNVLYKTGRGVFSSQKSNADIAEEAKKWTIIVECWK